MNCATYSQYWNETPEHVATVSSFALDKYEVTVSRFRAFVEAGGGTQASPPAAGSGAHPLIGNSGWDSAWNTSLAANQAALTANVACNPGPFQTWTPTAGANEEQPMSCVTWYEAFAFCIWDGGRLPSDAEWEYVAAGGDENRLYPWGSDSSVPLPATYSYFNYPGFIDVGSHSGGNGRWGHSDLAGSVHEWLLDWYDLNWYGTTAGGCTNCANLTPGSNRKTRSGSINSAAADIRVAFMGSASPASRFGDLGFRCARDPVPEGDSCAQMVGDECNGESCCTNAVVPDGTFPMGRGTEVCNGAGGAGGAGGGCIDGCPTGMDCSIYSNEQPEHPATVSAYALDKYEVTVGRFRAFVEADGGTQLNPPAPGSGAHPLIGSSGWESAWNAELPTNRTELEDRITCNAAQQTWTSIAEANEQYPMNCVSWFEAFAFCIWDGGRLPTEAEWEYAAAGGDENRLYPWGNDFLEPLPANYAATNDSPLVNVGSHEDGNGRWGHADLAGSMNEWVLDWYDYQYYPSVQSGCSNCVNLTPAIQGSWRVLRGGYWYNDADRLRAAGFRDCSEPYIRMTTSGWRCSRTP